VELILRDVEPGDLTAFFEYQLDPAANHMAAFTAKDPTDREAFDARWERVLGDSRITKQTIVVDGVVAGTVFCFPDFGDLEVSYWIDPAQWGKGIATHALQLFLAHVSTRPLYARAAKDNHGSIRVLEKCGFVKPGEDSGFADGRGEEIKECLFKLGE
jgi:RimJ/RimL family protein N-acetyltransferase